MNHCVRRELADDLRNRPRVVTRAARLEHGVREMPRLRNAARRAVELNVGFLHATDPTRERSASSGATVRPVSLPPFGPFHRHRSARFTATLRGTNH